VNQHNFGNTTRADTPSPRAQLVKLSTPNAQIFQPLKTTITLFEIRHTHKMEFSALAGFLCDLGAVFNPR
jgi:hypothetical protein